MAATAAGHAELVVFANSYPMVRAWAIEGTGGHGAGLTRHLLESLESLESPELVVELDRPEAVRATPRRQVRSP